MTRTREERRADTLRRLEHDIDAWVVVLIEGVATVVTPSAELAATFAKRTGFNPGSLRNYPYFRVEPISIQAWREVDEIAGRDLMHDGEWI